MKTSVPWHLAEQIFFIKIIRLLGPIGVQYCTIYNLILIQVQLHKTTEDNEKLQREMNVKVVEAKKREEEEALERKHAEIRFEFLTRWVWSTFSSRCPLSSNRGC